MIQCSSSGPCRLCYLSVAGQAVSWFQCPVTLQPGSWADYQYCWLPAGGSARSEGADTTLGISVKQKHLYRDLWWSFAQRLISYDRMKVTQCRWMHLPDPPYLWAHVTSQCCCSVLQWRCWTRSGLMKGQAWVTVQLRTENLREEERNNLTPHAETGVWRG